LRLEADGVDDEALLDAIRYHPLGHPLLDDLGRFLILADYLEPGRDGPSGRRRELRDRLPEGQREVLTVVVRQRIEKLLDRERPLMGCSVEFWNRLVGS
jgi:HD superfamily phosphohydrolase YqeK